jgi:predicted transposase YdaD
MRDKKNTIVVNNPHDKAFRKVYKEPENARSLIINALPERVVSLMDLSTLEICKDSFIEADLADYCSDMLYRVKFRDGSLGSVYVLFEHKSYFDKYVHLQILEYMVKIWRLHIDQQGKGESAGLPIVLPLLICHGRKEWPKDTVRFTSLLTGPVGELSSYIPDFGFELFDLSCFSDEEIKGEVMSRVVLLLFKYSHNPDFHHKLPGILSLLKTLMEKKTGLQYLETVLRYLTSVISEEELSLEKIKGIFEQSVSKEAGEYIMTIAEKLRNEGELRGRQEVKHERLRGGIEMGIVLRFPEDIDMMMTLVNKVEDLDTLNKVNAALKTKQDKAEILALLK